MPKLYFVRGNHTSILLDILALIHLFDNNRDNIG